MCIATIILQQHISLKHIQNWNRRFYDNNAAEATIFGDADCILCDANKIFEVTKKVLSHQRNCLMELEEIPKAWWT